MSVPMSRIALGVLVFSLSINFAQALPIDWTGTFGVDTHHISNFRRTSDDVTKTPGSKTGTQGIASGDNGASFQTYIFKLNPQIIVNDGVTLKGEFSTGHIRGGIAGDNSANNADGSGNNAYFFTTPSQRSALNVNQMYMELYADTALVKLGRFSRGYGLGAIFDNGNEAWDRFFTMYDGVEAEMKIGNFSLIPYWAKISSYDDAVDQKVQPNGGSDVRETGVVAKYHNKNRDLVVSVLYAKRFSESKNTLYHSDTDSSATSALRGKTEVTIIDPYIEKRWNKFKIAAEVPMMTGDYGNIYGDGSNTKISATSYIMEATYELNPKWEVGVSAGQVSGDKAGNGKFEGTYLHPNYQIADLMFRYNWPAFNEGGKSVFDSSIANARYVKLFGNYNSDKWTWKAAFIFATALETAKAGEQSYHHEENYRFTSTRDQDDNLGYEIDFGFDYRWNPNVVVSAHYGYWFVGDYYAFTNQAEELSLENVHGGGLSVTLEF